MAALCADLRPLGVVIQTIMQTDTPPEIRGRVFSAFTALNWMGMPVGLLIAGPLLQWYGSLVVMWVVAAILSAATIGILLSPALRRPQAAPEIEVAPE
jgi:MFS family permease